MLLHFDGFETYGANGATGANLANAMERVYYNDLTQDVDASVNDGYSSGLAIQMGSIYESQFFQWNVTPVNLDTFYFGFHIFLPDMSDGSMTGAIVWIRGITGTTHLSLWLHQCGGLAWRQGESGNYICWGGSLKKHRWYFVEGKVVIKGTATGSVELRVNGETVTSASSVQTSQDTFHLLGAIRFNSTLGGIRYDNFYLVDETAGGPVTFLGPCYVEQLIPTGDVVTDWTPSSGSNHYALVDETTLPNATDYVSTSTVNNADEWGYSNLANIETVFGVQTMVQAWLNQPGSRTLQITCNSGGTVNAQNIALVDANTVRYLAHLNKDPNGNVDWTPTAINAAQFGIKLGA